MCKALAQGMITAISKHAASRGLQAVEEDLQDAVLREAYQPWLQQFDPYSEETVMQADYASNAARVAKRKSARSCRDYGSEDAAAGQRSGQEVHHRRRSFVPSQYLDILEE